MNHGFWKNLPKPFFVLAPMANVTDTVFRQLIARYGQPDALWTEFVSCDGLCSEAGRERVLRDLQFSPTERPLVAQLFGARPTNVYEACRLVASLGFDGIDLNMGCPDKAIVKQGAGAGLIRTPSLATELILAAREGIAASGKTIPLSVKTRLGFDRDDLEVWIPTLLKMQLPVLTIHGRTKKELSEVPARWEQIKAVVELAKGTETRIIGNGDVRNLNEAGQRAEESGVDGVMLGRAVFGNPWLFARGLDRPSHSEVLRVLIEHTKLYEQTWGNSKPFDLMKKHFKAYVTGFPGAHELRIELMQCQTAQAVAKTIERFLAITTPTPR